MVTKEPLPTASSATPAFSPSAPTTFADTLKVGSFTKKPPSTVEVLQQATVDMNALTVQAQALTSEYSLEDDVDALNALLANIQMPSSQEPIALVDAEDIARPEPYRSNPSQPATPLEVVNAHHRALNAEMEKVRQTLSTLESP